MSAVKYYQTAAKGSEMPLQALYQVVLLGSGRLRHEEALDASLRRRFHEIGADIPAALKVIGPSDVHSLVPIAPAVAVYFGGDRTTDDAVLDRLIAQSMSIIPVVDDLGEYAAKTPAALQTINGMAIDWTAPDFTRLVNVILENLALLRRTRRLFLTYLRSQSSGVAHQLRVAFDDSGYDTFLDTSSVPIGDDFQSILWHRLLDSDVLVILDTENFLSSRWTREELAQASAMSLGMLRVVWPGVGSISTAELAEHLYLELADFDDDGLTQEALTRVVSMAEALRARCIAARHSNLIVEFCEEAKRVGANVAVQPNRYVLAKTVDGTRVAVVPAVGVPDAELYHEAFERFPAAGVEADRVVLIYDHRGMRPVWRHFLDWLDNYLPVGSLRVTETAARLEVIGKGSSRPSMGPAK